MSLSISIIFYAGRALSYGSVQGGWKDYYQPIKILQIHRDHNIILYELTS